MTRAKIPASYFGMVLGLTGLGQSFSLVRRRGLHA
jgi:hypothetical protein